MFKSEQNTFGTPKNHSKNGFLNGGMTMAKAVTVKRRITYREVTLIMGIIVAMVVAVTFWVKHQSQPHTSIPSLALPKISIPAASKTIVEAAINVIF